MQRDAVVDSDTSSRSRTELGLFVAAIAIVSLAALAPLLANHLDVTSLLRVGRYSASRSFIEQDFADPVLTNDAGHDGQQFYVVAATFPDVPKAEGHVDKVRYRGRRILFPASSRPSHAACRWRGRCWAPTSSPSAPRPSPSAAWRAASVHRPGSACPSPSHPR